MISSLAKKLQMKAGQRWVLLNAPDDYLTIFDADEEIMINYDLNESFHGIQLFVKSNAELIRDIGILSQKLQPQTLLWIIFPKKTSNISTDLEIMGSWDVMANYCLRPVTSAAIDKTWTALRFKPESLVNRSASRNDAIPQNNYAQYIDTEKRLVTLPLDVQQTLSAHPAAIEYFNKLAYTHKKEYVVWIVSAKQEKTREARVTKMLQMLLDNKKHPGDK
ncbi:YdeI/OmpD-associated family protein [Mucilaginibacter roseus]|uniref:YdeI/OmpD-associated family protein n=1 Tax=Mucilaginibacter roseus TaxID=1528868 RepID=A0ABS8U055_9SPHI|nr:YdeI/OmpD-associated family protein [Mucilaginibacter roseus]MCD8739470.1 YdeI/OmpD-associated family protein [Mucilaginibacter roseus]